MILPRPSIPLWVQLEAALHQLGIDPATAELDHDPALGLRERTDEGGYIPDANNPHYLKWRDRAAHAKKTRGVKATTAGSDVHLIAKGKRLRRAQAHYNARMSGAEIVLEAIDMTRRNNRRIRKIASRPFPKGRKFPTRPDRSEHKRARAKR